MKFLTGFKFNFTFEVHAPVVNNGELTHEFSYSSTGLVLPSSVGGVGLVCAEQIPTAYVVKNLLDIDGSNLLTAGGSDYPVYVTNVSPELLHSKIVGWRHTLRPEAPRNYDELFASLMETP